MWYVSMTDKFMSGWGTAENKIDKFVIACDNLQEARIIERNAKRRAEMRHVNICSKKPYYSKRSYVVTYRTFDELGDIWKKEV